MKNTIKMLGLAVVIAAITFSMTACEQQDPGDPTPQLWQYDVKNLEQVAGSVLPVIVELLNPGYSSGAVTVYYNGSETLPQEAGSYPITFDVAEAEGWQAATGLNPEKTLEVKAIPNPFTTIASLATWLASAPANTAANPFNIVLNVDSLGGRSTAEGSLGKVLVNNLTKFIKLDLSGSTLDKIETYAFYSVKESGGAIIDSPLVEIIIPDTVTTIEANAFYYCNNLVKVNIHDKVKTIGNDAFNNCKSLTSIDIPDSVTNLGTEAFAYTGLTSVTMPPKLTQYGFGFFAGCASLTEIKVAEGDNNFSTEDGVLYSKDGKSLYQYPLGKTGTSFEIPATVTEIKGYAFYGCKFTSITIPDAVTQIGNYAFSNSSLTSITIPDAVTTISQYAFFNCDSLTDVTIGSGITKIWQYAFNNCDKLTKITIPNITATFEEGVFGIDLIEVTFAGTSITLDQYGSFYGFATTQTGLNTLYSSGGAGTYIREARTSQAWVKKED